VDQARTCAGAGPERPTLSLAEVVRAGLASANRPRLSPHHWKVLNALLACRTPQLGGHRYRCENCGRQHFVPRSCGNRHCPTCQWRQGQEWLERQQALLLPVPYFHVVFTLTHVLNPLIQQNQAALYNLLLASASQTLLEFGRNNLGAQLGLTVVLHTWGQTLIDHYHVHCIVTGGGLAMDGGSWKSAPDGFLFPVLALGKVFRGKFCQGLQRLYAERQLQFHGQLSDLAGITRFQALVREATAKSWNVYANRPFAGPEQVLAYLARYTHRVAITQRRLLALNPETNTVRFAYKLRRDPARPVWTDMELDTAEFVRRFCQHILPERFVKIRHYGLLANRGRQERVAAARTFLGVRVPTPVPVQPGPLRDEPAAQPGQTPRLLCPYCGHRALVWVEFVRPGVARAPPSTS
jgi:hypothetical protein